MKKYRVIDAQDRETFESYSLWECQRFARCYGGTIETV